MKKILLGFILVFLMILFGCSNINTTKDENIQIDNEPKVSEISKEPEINQEDIKEETNQVNDLENIDEVDTIEDQEEDEEDSSEDIDEPDVDLNPFEGISDPLPIPEIHFKNGDTEKTSEVVGENEFIGINNFAFKTMLELVKENPNSDLFYSPASFYMALSMLAEGALDDTYRQLMDLLCCESLEELRNNNAILYNQNEDDDNGRVKLANSVWIDNSLNVNNEYLENLIKDYYAEAYNVNINSETLELIAKWINENTYDFLNVKKEDLEKFLDSVLILVNTIYFNSEWKKEFSEDRTYDQLFINDKENMIPFMHHGVNGNYYNTECFTCATDQFKNGYKIYYVLPKDDYSINDCFNDDLVNLLSGNILGLYNEINFSVPKFKFQNDLDLVNASIELGVVDVFDETRSNLSKIYDDLFVKNIKQIAGIQFDEKGVEAAAATIIGIYTTSVAPVYPIDFVLDRPFMYYITDNMNNVIFMGVCYNPTI